MTEYVAIPEGLKEAISLRSVRRVCRFVLPDSGDPRIQAFGRQRGGEIQIVANTVNELQLEANRVPATTSSCENLSSRASLGSRTLHVRSGCQHADFSTE